MPPGEDGRDHVVDDGMLADDATADLGGDLAPRARQLRQEFEIAGVRGGHRGFRDEGRSDYVDRQYTVRGAGVTRGHPRSSAGASPAGPPARGARYRAGTTTVRDRVTGCVGLRRVATTV